MELSSWKRQITERLKQLQQWFKPYTTRIGNWYQKKFGRFHPAVSTLILFGIGIGAMICMTGVLALSVYLGFFGSLPTYAEIREIKNPIASEVYDANGVLIGKYYIQNRINADYDEITPQIVNALIATEDARFFEHRGIDPRALARVLWKSLILGRESSGGGSTLSQQLAKNLFPRKEYYILSLPINKFREIFTARRLENSYSKEDLIRLYLNTVPFGDNIFGIKVASQRYFNASPKKLQLQEVATLIGLLKANSYYHPHRHPERATTRRNTVLTQMTRYGYLRQHELDSLVELPMETRYQPEEKSRSQAAYFREHLRKEVEELLQQYPREKGRNYNLYTDGLKIYTTLDARLQRYAEAAVEREVARAQRDFEKDWGKRSRPWEKRNTFMGFLKKTTAYQTLAKTGLSEDEILEKLKKKHPMEAFSWEDPDHSAIKDWSTIDSLRSALQQLQAGFLAVEPQTGRIRAWVGGIDYRYFQYDHVKSRRQVGSVFKPIVYAQALRSGMLPCEYTANERTTYEAYDDWSPRNADGKYGGAYSMEGALAKSVNTVSVSILQRGGLEPTAMLARDMGISGKVQSVPSMALGTNDASLWEMVTVFSTLAAKGKRPRLHYLDRIETSSGEEIIRMPRPDPREFEQVLEPETAAIVTHMLETVVDRGTAQRLRSLYKLDGPIAGKTGTTQSQSDGWFIGFTPKLVAGAWVGAESPKVHFRSLYRGQGANTALPIWARFYQEVRRNRRTRHWVQGSFTPPNDTSLAYLECPSYVDELPVLDDVWATWPPPPLPGAPGERFPNRNYSPVNPSPSAGLPPRLPGETSEQYIQRIRTINERRYYEEEQKRKRREYFEDVFFRNKKGGNE